MGRRYFVGIMLAMVGMPVIAVAVLSLTHSFEVKELPVFGTLPAFELTERSGEKISLDGLKGKVWIASFIFTHCAGQCPLIAEKVKEIQGKLRFKDKLRLVSISVDPERDTPAVLTEYARRYDADPYKWLFLTGETNTINALTQNGFRLSSGGEGEQINHSFKLVLVDGFGRIRGYYDATEDATVKQLIRDTKRLIKKTYGDGV